MARANQGGTWSQPLAQVVEGYNETPHSTVHGAPATAGDRGIQQFLVYQDQARNYEHNKVLTNLRKSRLEAAGAFRVAIPNGGRRHKPAFGPVHELEKIEPGALRVVGTRMGPKHSSKRFKQCRRGLKNQKQFLRPRCT